MALDVPQVDESKALAELEKTMNKERELKTKFITLLIRIKNTLKKDQQEKLRSLATK